MGFLDNFKGFSKADGYVDKNGKYYGNIYKELGMIEPFTLLVDEQFNNFISELSENKLLNDDEREALDTLWYAACIDIDGFGNNIPFLEAGTFVVYDKNGVTIRFEKRESNLDDDSSEGRANFVYLSNEGNFIINQNERNKKAFLVYVSENITNRLLQALREAECRVLRIKKSDEVEKENVGIPDGLYASLLDRSANIPVLPQATSFEENMVEGETNGRSR